MKITTEKQCENILRFDLSLYSMSELKDLLKQVQNVCIETKKGDMYSIPGIARLHLTREIEKRKSVIIFEPNKHLFYLVDKEPVLRSSSFFDIDSIIFCRIAAGFLFLLGITMIVLVFLTHSL